MRALRFGQAMRSAMFGRNIFDPKRMGRDLFVAI
jgi:hypothetical protein